jgi:hypothetical protein
LAQAAVKPVAEATPPATGRPSAAADVTVIIGRDYAVSPAASPSTAQ